VSGTLAGCDAWIRDREDRPPTGPAEVEGLPFPGYHDGYSGFWIDGETPPFGISEYLPYHILVYRPHIVLLHIGTNDLQGRETDALDRLTRLVDAITGADPDLLLVVA
jgi:lysophospholipase L1-like esterase